ncbi:MAG: hypothetical protein MUC48_17745 [Leptolyngbya sp. Prado105]|jgi:hypothetical protein|nr:hypothetical protein [Leptolyngbya sp. Prado105]
MSEAETPKPSPDSIEIPQAETQIQSSESWTTVNFPNAIEVDSVPKATDEPQPSQVGWRFQDLEQQNQRLRSRVAELEFSLGEAHAALRAETKRLETQLSTQQAEAEQRSLKESQLSQQQTVMIAKQRQALDASRQRLKDQEAQLAEQLETINAMQAEATQFSQSLEQSHQVQQKQQILIETLTTQLESSQSRVAQLERDCALTKQQYDEQIQHLRQSESDCKDLRSRLNRQQQYTLQFKAALEKCLDVSATQKIEASVDQAISQSECQSDPVEFTKAQPVQPWSTTLESSSPWHQPELTPVAWATAPDEESLFVESETGSDEIAVEPFEEEVPFADLPFAIDEAELPEPIVIHPALSYTIKRSTDEPASVHQSLNLFAPAEIQAQSEPELEPENPEEPAIEVEATPEIAPVETGSEIAVDSSLLLSPVTEPVVQSVSPFITLGATDRIRRDEPIERPEMGESPSPVVYPQRSQKKLDSLAAVELPTFPKK